MSESDEEEILLYVEVNGLLDAEVLDDPKPFFKLIGLDTDQPVMQIGREVFSGKYRDVLGTAMFFEEDPLPPGVDPVFGKVPNIPLHYVCKTNKSLIMNRVFLKEKKSEQNREKTNSVNNEDKTSSLGSVTNIADSLSSEDLISQVSTLMETTQPTGSGASGAVNEPTPGPSWASDSSSLDVLNILSKHMDPSTEEISRLITEQMGISSDVDISCLKKTE